MSRPLLRGQGRGDGHHQRHGQTERMRAGDDHHGHGAFDGEGEVLAHENQPDQEGDRAAAQGNDGEPHRGGVGEVLGLRFAFLGLFDEVDDLRQKRILAGAFDLDGQRAFAVDGAADDLAAGLLGDRGRFPGEHRLIDRALALHDDTVRGDLLTRLDQDLVIHRQFAQRHVLHAAVGHELVGVGGHEFGQFLQGPRGAHHRLHLDPVPEQHDVDEGGQLPEEHLAGQAEHHGAAVEIGGGDGDGDQRHHPGLAGFEFLEQAFEERPAAIPEDRGRKAEQDVDVAGKTNGFSQSHQRLEHRREDENRQGQDQRDPEPFPEIRRHVGMVVGSGVRLPGGPGSWRLRFRFLAGCVVVFLQVEAPSPHERAQPTMACWPSRVRLPDPWRRY